MYHARIDRQGATPCRLPGMSGQPTATPSSPALAQRRRRGRCNWQAGLAAEEIVARRYQAGGATVRARRLRTPGGEIDIIAECGGVLVFVEVKRRARQSSESPVSERQWCRLENAALCYMFDIQRETGVVPVCRFDVALVGPDGQTRIIENARSFDEH